MFFSPWSHEESSKVPFLKHSLWEHFRDLSWVPLTDRNTSLSSLPNPVVLPKLVFWENSRGCIAPLMLFFGFIHCLLIGLLCLKKLIMLSNCCLGNFPQLVLNGYGQVGSQTQEHLTLSSTITYPGTLLFTEHRGEGGERRVRCSHTEWRGRLPAAGWASLSFSDKSRGHSPYLCSQSSCGSVSYARLTTILWPWPTHATLKGQARRLKFKHKRPSTFHFQ